MSKSAAGESIVNVFVRTFREEFAKEMGRPTEAIETKPLSSKELSENFDGAMNLLGEMFETAKGKQFGGMRLDTMEVHLEVTANGKFAFLGSEAGLKGTTSFKLLFKRQKAPA